MSRYIDADALKQKWLFRGKDGKPYRDEIDSMPTADVVEVVRCKDCKHYNGDSAVCKRMNRIMKDDGFCSYGERREDED